jgi:Domain of unknown function (DUF4136)
MARAHLAAAALAVLAACSTVQVQTEFAEQTDFSRYRTWAWGLKAAGSGQDPRVRDPAVRALIVRTVERELAARGFRRVEPSAGPDFLVDFFGWTQERTDVRQSGSGLRGSGYTYDPGASSAAVTDVRTLRDGTLIIDVLDAATRRRTWRGTATDSAVAGTGPGAVEGGVVALLERFPPGKR